MLRSYKIKFTAMIMTVLFLALGELATGTDPRFVLMMCIAMLSIAATYNLLGGVSTFSGILLAGFALRTIVISQFAKVLLFERADQNLNSPQLTITVYAVFYFMMLVGVFLFGRFRLHMPKTLEMETLATKRTAYILAFPLGLVGTLLYEMNSQMYSTSVSSQFGPLHSIGVALSPLLLLALVLSVDIMIEKSGGRSSVGWTTIAPAVILVGCAMADTVRTSVLVPAIAYILTCYLRGYHFRAKHYAYFALAMFLFTWIVSPLGIYVRGFTQTSDMRFFQRVSAVFKVAMSYSPAELASFTSTVAEMDLHEQYFNARGTFVLSRLSLIRADSNLIEACSSGFHYGLAEIKEQISKDLPSFMIKNKSRIPENNYIANISGLGVDSEMAQPVLTAVADSYGAFGWVGVVVVGMFFVPMVYIVYESLFDISKPWGTLVLGATFLQFGEMSLSRLIFILTSFPIWIVLCSYILGYFSILLSARGVPNTVAFARE